MKYSVITILTCCYIMFTTSCSNDNGKNELAHHHEHTEAHNHDDHRHDGHNDSDGHDEHDEHGESKQSKDHNEIVLQPEMAKRFGVTTETVKPGTFRDVIKVSGTIMPSTGRSGIVSSPASGIIYYANGIERGSQVSAGTIIAKVRSNGISGGDPNKAAKATLDACKRELDRLTPLYEDRLVTASEYNAALRAYEEADAAYSAKAATGTVTSPITGIITSIDVAEGQFVQVGEAIASVSSSERLTLRADVPEKYFDRLSAFDDATISLPYSDINISLSSVEGKRISQATTAAVTPGYIPVYFSFKNNGTVIPGANVETYLLGNKSDDVITVPLTSLSEQQGLMYVFVKLDDECYTKVPVTTGRSDGKRIEITGGLKDGDEVVATGTTTVRIAESSGVIPEGHSHNH